MQICTKFLLKYLPREGGNEITQLAVSSYEHLVRSKVLTGNSSFESLCLQGVNCDKKCHDFSRISPLFLSLLSIFPLDLLRVGCSLLGANGYARPLAYVGRSICGWLITRFLGTMGIQLVSPSFHTNAQAQYWP